MGQLSTQELAAVEAVARRFSAECETANEDWPDAYLTIDGKQIAVAVASPDRRNAEPGSPTMPRLRFDKVALRFVRGLQTGLGGFVPDDRTVIVTITAPIRLPAKTAAALEEKIRAGLARRSAQAEVRATIHGNQIRVRIVQGNSNPMPKVIGFVHNADSDRDILFDLTESLIQYVDAAARNGTAKRFAGDRWLVVADDVGPSYVDTYRHIISQLSISTEFKKILMVRADGQVDDLTG